MAEFKFSDFKKMMTLALSIMLVQGVLALLVANAANAQESLMTALDHDQDGLISLREAVSDKDLLENFNKIDTNDDGFLSLDELDAHIAAQAKD
ncbi:calcium-binding protein [Glaciecola sp. MH2013]|uniref:calcium-binding protein n=1 Tax=Glaciecola sp. MH2013 TaxID=2785524 RepID=UPI00189C6118|nr:calcium-binding protein [Glaciecola sp. MH2013]MBF7073181.1 calcium-binding protein [Glaciecola sp. MH2013]